MRSCLDRAGLLPCPPLPFQNTLYSLAEHQSPRAVQAVVEAVVAPGVEVSRPLVALQVSQQTLRLAFRSGLQRDALALRDTILIVALPVVVSTTLDESVCSLGATTYPLYHLLYHIERTTSPIGFCPLLSAGGSSPETRCRNPEGRYRFILGFTTLDAATARSRACCST